MLRVMQKHADAAKTIDADLAPCAIRTAAIETWSECLSLGARHGYRNAQATVLAPTGTIGFMMDCDTTGIEPDIALVKYKKLVGGGLLKIVNNTVPTALKKLGYGPNQITEMTDYIDQHETIEGAPGLRDGHLPVFDCAFKPVHGVRSIHYMGHVKMMAAVQPFISGAISKTVNMPGEATADEIMEAYVAAWKLGLKAIAIYRDGSKRTQPLNVGKEQLGGGAKKGQEEPAVARPVRHRLPEERRAITHKFSIGGHDGYITVGMYEDGQPGEIFITMSKEGSVVSGLMDGFATAISMALQYGVPLEVLCSKFSHMRFEPSGYTSNKEIPIAKSILDYIFRWLSLKFLADKRGASEGVEGTRAQEPEAAPRERTEEAGRSGAGGGNGAAGTASRPGKAWSNIWLESESPRDGAATQDRKPAGAEASGLSFESVLKAIEAKEKETFIRQADAPPCFECGAIMVRNGACYKCLNCGAVFGCS
jgi:ribonucleoside-diphosphate reductase alpha chain